MSVAREHDPATPARPWRRSPGTVALGMGMAALGLGLAFVSQFVLDPWAGISRFGDWVQHGVIFWGAVAVAAGITLAAARTRPGDHAGGTGTTAPMAGRWRPPAIPLAAVVIGAAVAVGCEFALDPWAGTGLTGDSVQHAVIFAGGLAAGAGATALHLVGRRR